MGAPFVSQLLDCRYAGVNLGTSCGCWGSVFSPVKCGRWYLPPKIEPESRCEALSVGLVPLLPQLLSLLDCRVPWGDPWGRLELGTLASLTEPIFLEGVFKKILIITSKSWLPMIRDNNEYSVLTWISSLDYSSSMLVFQLLEDSLLRAGLGKLEPVS